jgi:predicted TIM-barrel fold metal-dependent hydrolase
LFHRLLAFSLYWKFQSRIASARVMLMPSSHGGHAHGLPVHFHTIGSGVRRDFTKLAPKVALAARAAGITSFQMYMSEVLLSVIFSGVLEHHPGIKLVIGEAGTGWIPYILQRMDAEWEDQFKELDLKMPPSEYWRRQCYATYQSDPIGVKLLDELGEDNIMWGSRESRQDDHRQLDLAHPRR